LGDGGFTHGVASGDPTATSVIIWTRFIPRSGADGPVRWQVATDEAFTRIAAQRSALATPATDYCVRVDARGLASGHRYFYRFLSRSGPSVTGLTRTAPARGRDPLTIAGFACSMLPVGYFRAYADAAARDDIDLCAHVGDYIYEYGPEPAWAAGAFLPGRMWGPNKEIVTYADYAERYASYRADPDLQELHRVKPFVHVWDDHEFTNDAWRDGAQNHQPETEGPWLPRRDAAAKAWFDWLPVRTQRGQPRRIHHTIKWGDLAHIIMLDSRLMRDNQPDSWQSMLGDFVDGDRGRFNSEAQRLWKDVIGAPTRTVLGTEQEAWLARQLKASRDGGMDWQILIQGSVLGRFQMPTKSESWLAPNTSQQDQKTRRILAQVGELGLPYDTPLWNGYPAARDRLAANLKANASNVFAFGGETHVGWAFNIPGGKDGPAAIEIACTAVTSSNGFRPTGFDDVTREAALIEASPELAWCDVHHWGYTSVKFDAQTATANFTGFRSVLAKDTPVAKRSQLVAATSCQGVRPWVVDSAA
jgi:alkaline phosphatase D